MVILESRLIIAPYGAPCETSEVNCIPGFYRAEALTAGFHAPVPRDPRRETGTGSEGFSLQWSPNGSM